MAKSVVYEELGSPDVLHVVDAPDPQPGPDQVVVEIRAAGVNPIDAKLRAGVRPSAPVTAPRRVGFDGAGTIIAIGDGVTDAAVGDRVAVRQTLGTYATHVVAPRAHVTALPESVSFEQGAALGIPAGTAYQVLRSLGVSAGDTLLVHGGSGAVGRSAVQFAVAWGARVIATGSTVSHDGLRQLGAIPVAYGAGLVDRVRRAADEVTVVLDGAGTDEALQASVDLVSDRARIATIVRGPDAAAWGIRAFSGGSPEPLTAEEEQWRADALPHTIDLIADGDFRVELGTRFPLEQAAEAHRLVESGSPGGKLLITP